MDSLKLQNDVREFVEDIKHNSNNGSFFLAHALVSFLSKILKETPWKDESDIKQSIEAIGKKLNHSLPNESCFENIITKFLRVFEEECKKSSDNVDCVDCNSSNLDSTFSGIAEEVMNELMTEVDGCRENIASQSSDFIHPNDIVLTVGYSKTVEMFLKSSRKTRNLKVWIPNDPKLNGFEMMERLKSLNVDARLADEDSMVTMMSTITKVVIGARLVMPGSGLMCSSGVFDVVRAAQMYSIPVIACIPNFKFTNQMSCCSEMASSNVFVDNNEIIPMELRHKFSDVEMKNPLFEFVPIRFVGSIITNV